MSKDISTGFIASCQAKNMVGESGFIISKGKISQLMFFVLSVFVAGAFIYLSFVLISLEMIYRIGLFVVSSFLIGVIVYMYVCHDRFVLMVGENGFCLKIRGENRYWFVNWLDVAEVVFKDVGRIYERSNIRSKHESLMTGSLDERVEIYFNVVFKELYGEKISNGLLVEVESMSSFHFSFPLHRYKAIKKLEMFYGNSKREVCS
jgi:hypothetical protein